MSVQIGILPLISKHSEVGGFGLCTSWTDLQVLSSSWTPQEPDFNDILQIYITEGGLVMNRL